MKRIIGSFMLFGALLATSGCYEDVLNRISLLEDRIDQLQLTCDNLNRDLSSIQELVTAIQRMDMITGVTEIRSDNTVTGYKINFVSHDPITISNGQDGKVPLVSSQRDTDGNWYWCVQYGDGEAGWLYAPDGSKMLAIGILPLIVVRNDTFYYTTDGVTYTELGKANGRNGDQMFRSVDTSNKDYVLITLTNGEVLKIPTYAAWQELKGEFDKVNQNATGQMELILARKEKFSWITRIAPILSGKDTTGMTVTLNNGKSFSIHDWTSSLSPSIFVKRGSDGHLYWAYSIGLSGDQWVLSSRGLRIPAESEPVDIPVVSVTQDTDGQYYWTVTTGDQTEFLRSAVDTTWAPHAIDSVARAFSAVRNYTDSLVIVLKDSTTRFVLPKQYTVNLTDENGKAVDGTLTMAEGKTRTIRYTANGTDATLTLLPQAGFSASETTLDDGPGIVIKAPASFTSGTAKIVAVFTFPTDVSPVTVIKTITINKEG